MAERTTARVEGMEYCMLGIIDINMPLLYGEGSKAFIRLQEEIMRISADQTIFCWGWTPSVVPDDWPLILAPSPAAFKECGDFHPKELRHDVDLDAMQYALTNIGLTAKLSTLPGLDGLYCALNVYRSRAAALSSYMEDYGSEVDKTTVYFLNLSNGPIRR